jgi:hypothetical protein
MCHDSGAGLILAVAEGIRPQEEEEVEKKGRRLSDASKDQDERRECANLSGK